MKAQCWNYEVMQVSISRYKSCHHLVSKLYRSTGKFLRMRKKFATDMTKL